MDAIFASSEASVIRPTLNAASLVSMNHTIFESFLAVAIIDLPDPFAVFMASYRSMGNYCDVPGWNVKVVNKED